MPKYTPTDEDLESLYSEPAAEEKAPETPEKADPTAEAQGDGADGAETLISKSALPEGVKEGDVISVKVTKDYGDECGLQVVSAGETEQKEPSADEEIDALAEEG